MSMAHGLESRVPFLDHPLVEFLATVPADVKFKGGQMKQLMRLTYAAELPAAIAIAATRWVSRCRSRSGLRANCATSSRTPFAVDLPGNGHF